MYAVWITIAKGQSASKAQIRTLLEKGLAIDPAYCTLYSSVCQTLWPRWGGSRAEIRDFFNWVHESTKERMGEKMYAFVVDSQFCPGAIYGNSGDWSLLRRGFDQILDEYPKSCFYLNRYCLLACVFGDKEKARELFGRIGDYSDNDAWVCKEENFKGAKRWAMSDVPLPDFFRVEGHPPGNPDERVPYAIPVPAAETVDTPQIPLSLSDLTAASGDTPRKSVMAVAALAACILTALLILLIVFLIRKGK